MVDNRTLVDRDCVKSGNWVDKIYDDTSYKSESERLQFILHAIFTIATILPSGLKGQHIPFKRFCNPNGQSVPLHGVHFV